jgi:hypothetical protein
VLLRQRTRLSYLQNLGKTFERGWDSPTTPLFALAMLAILNDNVAVSAFPEAAGFQKSGTVPPSRRMTAGKR